MDHLSASWRDMINFVISKSQRRIATFRRFSDAPRRRWLRCGWARRRATATRGIINFTTPDRVYGSRRPVFSYGYPLASLPSYPYSHVRNTYETRARVYSCTCVISRIIKVSRPSATGTKEVRKKERERNGVRVCLFFFPFHPADVLARIDAHVHAFNPDWGPKYTREFTLASVAELIGIAVWVRVIAGSQTRRYRPLPVHVSAPANTFLLLRVHLKRTHHAAL